MYHRNKKVLLRERKRHTALHVASAHSAVVSRLGGERGAGGRGVPPSSLVCVWGGGLYPHSVSTGEGYPFQSQWEGGYPIQSQLGGTPIQS